MADRIELIGRSVIQHGPGNDRVYLMKQHPDDAPALPEKLDRLASEEGYSKIFAKVPSGSAGHFLAAGFGVEAEIPGFYPTGEPVCFLGKYLTPERRREKRPALVREVLSAASTAAGRPGEGKPPLPDGYSWAVAGEGNADELAVLFGQVFDSYPFPIHQASFIVSSMKGATLYFGVRQGEGVVAASSAEMDPDSKSVEMTDFAILPAYRGQGIALFLLQRMEEAMEQRGIRSFFTIARAYSFGMNIAFARNGYHFAGTLTNNTNIAGSLESMNVWYKTRHYYAADMDSRSWRCRTY